MNIQEFINNFAAQFDETDPAEITATTEFKQLEEWSSLAALSIIAMVDEEYDISLKGDDIRNTSTVEELYKIVKEKKEQA